MESISNKNTIQTLSLRHHSGCLQKSAEIIPANLIRIMPAQGNVTAPLAVLRMKKHFIHEKTPHFQCAYLPHGLVDQYPFGTTNQERSQFQ